MAAGFAYLGNQTMLYQGYLDEATGRMLIAGPGNSYEMSAVDPGLPVPPGDGRWQAADDDDSAPVWSSPPSPEPASEPAEPAPAPEGGETE